MWKPKIEGKSIKIHSIAFLVKINIYLKNPGRKFNETYIINISYNAISIGIDYIE